MRKVFLEDLPKIGKTTRIDFCNCINYKVKFIYENIESYFVIKEVKSRKIVIEYEDKLYEILKESLYECYLGKMLGTIKNTEYEIGDVIELENANIKVIDKKIRNKSGGLIYVVECLSCGKVWNIEYRSISRKVRCTGCSRTKFKLSKDGLYYIGTTQKDDEFWFDGDEDVIEYIKTFTWRKTTYGYFQNSKGEKLHRIVMRVADRNIYVNHLGGDRWDNRKEKLSVSDYKDNCKEKKTNGKSGIVGLLKRGKQNKWVGNIKIKDVSVYSKYKEKDEALIDLLIMQRHYGFRHNENLYHILNGISKKRTEEVIENIELQLNKKRNDKIVSTNDIVLSEDKSFYWVYDKDRSKKINKFKISLENKESVEKGIWHVAKDKSHTNLYIHGSIVVDGTRKTVKLHRYLMGMLDIKYKNWFIDHLDGDGTNNALENLIITDAQGNGINKPLKGYAMRFGKWRTGITTFGKSHSATVDTEEEAIEWIRVKKEQAMKDRIQFKNREELDTYLLQIAS